MCLSNYLSNLADSLVVSSPSLIYYNKQTKQTPWPESANELYRPSDSRLSAKFVPTFADRECPLDSVTDHYGPKPLLFLPSSSSIVLTRLSRPRSLRPDLLRLILYMTIIIQCLSRFISNFTYPPLTCLYVPQVADHCLRSRGDSNGQSSKLAYRNHYVNLVLDCMSC
jgi:hypothetical protein